MKLHHSLTFVLIYTLKIINATATDEEADVSVDMETPRIKGLKLDISEDNSQTNDLKWQLGVIPYYIDSNIYDSIISKRIRTAMDVVEGASCVVFKSMDGVPKRSNGSWLHFTNPSQERECVHEPALGEDGEMIIVLGFECMQRRDVLHSVLHAVGFKDEVSHPHRDQYVRILWQNIQPKYRPLYRIQFNGERTKNLVEYDPMSVMHFHDRAFSINGGATIAPLVPGLVINPSDNLSQLDKMKLQLYFGHECNKRKVGDILDTCKNVLHESHDSVDKEDLMYPTTGPYRIDNLILEVTESQDAAVAGKKEKYSASTEDSGDKK